MVPGGGGGGGVKGGMPPSGPVKISHEKDDHRILSHRFHVSWPLSYLATGSATARLFAGITGSLRCEQPQVPLLIVFK